MVRLLVKVPVAEVEKVYPASGPTTIFAVVRFAPVMSNELGPAVPFANRTKTDQAGG